MKWTVVLLYVVITGLILAVFQPFEYRLNSVEQMKALLCFMAIAFFCSSFVLVLLPKLFRNFYHPDNWSVKREIFNSTLLLLSSGICVFIYDYFILSGHFPQEYWNREFFVIFAIDMFAAITIGSIPLVICLFMLKNKELKRNLNEAILLSKMLSEKVKQEDGFAEISSLVELRGETRDSIIVKPQDVFYLEASGNYVDVCYLDQGTVRHKLLRSTIKQMGETLKVHNGFLRCHRAYIVNINKVETIKGNAQGYRLGIKEVVEIPVSRTYLEDFRSAFRPKSLG